jgi:putative DNA primase/helicase
MIEMDWQAIAPDVGQILLGEPNRHLSTLSETRWNGRGSVVLNVPTGQFYDHELGEGGGVSWLIQRDGWSVPDFLESHGFSDGTIDLSLYQAKREQTQAKQTADQIAKSARANRIWNDGIQIEGTPAETYLKSRAIDRWPDTLRYSDGALLFPFKNDAGKVIAVQRIILDDQGQKKSKLSLGPVGQGVCLLAGTGDLHLTEGPETGLSVWLATGAPVMICAGPISAKRVEQAGTGPLVLASDAADEGAAVLTTLARACDAATTYRLAVPEGANGTDWNDTLQAAGLAATRDMLARGEWIGSTRPATYAAPTGSVEQARATVADALASWADALDVQAMRIGTGIGKSHAARVTAVDMVRKLRAKGETGSVVIAVQRHDLGSEYIKEIQDQGVSIRVWRGRTQPDDAQSGKMMCHRPKAAEKAARAGVNIGGTLCKNGETACYALKLCGYQKQVEAVADIWIIPHAMLWSAPPSAIKAAALIVDEDPTGDVFGGIDGPYRISLDDLKAPLPGLSDNQNANLTEVTSPIVNAMLQASEGDPTGKETPFNRMDISRTGNYIENLVKDVKRTPYIALDNQPCAPNTQGEKFNDAMERAGLRNRRALRMARLLKILDAAIEGGKERVTGLTVETAKTPDGDTYKAARMRWRKDLHEGWQVPTMIMSATLDEDLLRYIWPDLAKVTIAEAAMPHVKVRQITDSANPKSGLLVRQADGTFIPKGGRIKRLAQYAEARAHELGGKVLVIGQMDVIAALNTHGLPDTVSTVHYNALSGLDGFKDARGLIVIGRTLPAPNSVEVMREILTGKAGEKLPVWYKKADAALNMDGTGHGPRVFAQAGHGGRITYGTDRHPDQITENLRWMICEGEVMQGIGRGRGVNRSADNPLQIDILTHIPLPLAVDEAGTFAQFEPHPCELMAARGVVVQDTSARGALGVIAAMLPDVFADAKAVENRKVSSRPYNRNSIIYGYKGVRDGNLKLEGGRYAVQVKIAEDATLPLGATFTETPTEARPIEVVAPPRVVVRMDGNRFAERVEEKPLMQFLAQNWPFFCATPPQRL